MFDSAASRKFIASLPQSLRKVDLCFTWSNILAEKMLRDLVITNYVTGCNFSWGSYRHKCQSEAKMPLLIAHLSRKILTKNPSKKTQLFAKLNNVER